MKKRGSTRTISTQKDGRDCYIRGSSPITTLESMASTNTGHQCRHLPFPSPPSYPTNLVRKGKDPSCPVDLSIISNQLESLFGRVVELIG